MNGKRNILFVDKDAYPSLEEPELFDTLAAGAGSIRVERIVSNGQVNPEGEWYDQDLDEWVVVRSPPALHGWRGSGAEERGFAVSAEAQEAPGGLHQFPVHLAGHTCGSADPAVGGCRRNLRTQACGGFSPRRRGNSSYGRIPFFAPCIGHEKRVCREANP